MSTHLEMALEYAKGGMLVFPLGVHSKLPLISKADGGRGFLDATTDPVQIKKWWKRSPIANIGLATGHGWLALDLDLYKAGYDAETVESWRLPPTLTSCTPSGGRHLIFSYSGELRTLAEGTLAAGVCVKSLGGYIAAPPSSLLINGFEQWYLWEDDEQPIAKLPARLRELIEAKLSAPRPVIVNRTGTANRSLSGAQKWLDDALRKTGDGVGDIVGYELAQQLLIMDKNGEVVDVDGILLQYANAATLDWNDPFDQRDVERWKRSASGSKLVARAEPARAQTSNQNGHSHNSTVQTTPRAKSDMGVVITLPKRGSERPDAEAQDPDESDQDALLGPDPDDNGNAEAMWRLYGSEFLYSPVYGWLKWAKTHWRECSEPIVAQYAIKTLVRRRKAAVEASNEAIVKTTKGDRQRVMGCLALFKSYVIEDDVTRFDADPDLLNCQNGVLNLRTGQVVDHHSSQRFTYCLPIAYEPETDSSEWRAFLLDALDQDMDAALYLQRCIGYSLTGHTNEEKMFYLHGPTRAGKGTMTETLLALMPRPLAIEVDFNTFTAKRDNDSQNFDLAPLKPARMVIASESTRTQSLNTAKAKQLTGGNLVHCAFKHRDMFTYRPQFKVWLVSNHTINADADDDAAWGRVQVFSFPNSHLGDEDTSLKARMQSAANLRAVLAWAVRGAKLWYEAGLGPQPESMSETARKHRQEQDYITQWIDDECTLDEEKFTSSAALIQSYTQWCDANKVRALRPKDLAAALVNRFHCVAARINHGSMRGYTGIAVGKPVDPFA